MTGKEGLPKMLSVGKQKGFIGLIGLLAAVLIIGLLFIMLNRYAFSPAGSPELGSPVPYQNTLDRANDLKNQAEDLDKQREEQVKDLENLR